MEYLSTSYKSIAPATEDRMVDKIVGYDEIKCTFVRSLTSKEPGSITKIANNATNVLSRQGSLTTTKGKNKSRYRE